MQPKFAWDLAQWLGFLEGLHPKAIDLGLARVMQVRQTLLPRVRALVITVGGTNGKGSTCGYLESILTAAGYHVGLYTSPHLLVYNERVRIDKQAVTDNVLTAAFAAIEVARGDTSLSYFEFGTLAAMRIFEAEAVDVAILEVGLGGRLDAVNVFDCDCAVITSIDIDHTEYLGTSREQIGWEKAGIFRAGRPAICGDSAPPQTMLDHAKQIGVNWRAIETAYRYQMQDMSWDYYGEQVHKNLPLPAMHGDYQLANAATAIAALEVLRQRLPVSTAALRQGLQDTRVPGRFQILPGAPQRILDVAHNPHGARALATSLAQLPVAGRRYAVFGMLADKDIVGVVAALIKVFDVWLIAGLAVPRGASAVLLQTILAAAGADQIVVLDTIEAAWNLACEQADENDRICVFGSFYTVAAVLRLIDE